MQPAGNRYIYPRLSRVVKKVLFFFRDFFANSTWRVSWRRRRRRCPGYPKSRPVRRIKDCFASFLQKNATPPPLRSHWPSAYINITVWHASTARRPLIGCFLHRVNHLFLFFLFFFSKSEVMWAEEGDKRRRRVLQLPAGVCWWRGGALRGELVVEGERENEHPRSAVNCALFSYVWKSITLLGFSCSRVVVFIFQKDRVVSSTKDIFSWRQQQKIKEIRDGEVNIVFIFRFLCCCFF